MNVVIHGPTSLRCGFVHGKFSGTILIHVVNLWLSLKRETYCICILLFRRFMQHHIKNRLLSAHVHVDWASLLTCCFFFWWVIFCFTLPYNVYARAYWRTAGYAPVGNEMKCLNINICKYVWSQIKQEWVILIHLRLWIAVARHNLKWLKIKINELGRIRPG